MMTSKRDESIKFSIIMPVFNVKEYVESAIESVLNQTYSNIELIIVNDGSTDGSRKIVEDLSVKDSRIKLIHCPNRGLSMARNTGLNIASGNFIFFMDSDDIVDINLFQIAHDKISSENQNVLMIGYEEIASHYTYLGKNVLPGIHCSASIIHNILSKKLENYVWQFIIAKSILSENLLFHPNVLFEDIDWTARFLSKIESVYYINKPLYKYRIRDSSITHTRNFQKAHDLLIVLDLLEKTLNENFPSELPNFRLWRKSLDLTIYFDFSILGWETKRLRNDMYSKILSYNGDGLDLKQKIKLILIKFRVMDFFHKLKGNDHEFRK